MHFSLTYISAIFLIFACLASASPVPVAGPPSVYGPSSGTSDTPPEYFIVPVHAGSLFKLRSQNEYIARDSRSQGVLIVEEIPLPSIMSINIFSDKQGIKYRGTFVGPLDTGGEEIKKIPYASWRGEMPGFCLTLTRSGLFNMANNPLAIMVEKVKIYDTGSLTKIGLLSEQEYKTLNDLKSKHGG